jgi:hypothetical protein
MELKKVVMHLDKNSATVVLKPSGEQGMFIGRDSRGMVAGSEVSMYVTRTMAEALVAGQVEVLADCLDRSSDDGSVRVDLRTPVHLGDSEKFGLSRLDNNSFTEVEPVSQPLTIAFEPDMQLAGRVSLLDFRGIMPVQPE